MPCAQVSSYDLEPLPDLEADFGPSVPSMGIEGVLRVSRPAQGSPSMLRWLFISQPMHHSPPVPCCLAPLLPMQLADPRDACSPFTYTDYGTPWVALISRQQQLHAMNCTFDIKVRTLGNNQHIYRLPVFEARLGSISEEQWQGYAPCPVPSW